MFDDEERIITKHPLNKQLVPAIAYARVSTRSKDQKNSFENQQQIFIEQAEKLGYYLVKECGKNGIYADRGISGKSLKKRDQFNKMMEDSKKGLFKQVLTTNIARYSRDVVTLQDTVRKLRNFDIGVFFLKENINTGDYAKTYGEEVMLNILGSLAQNDLVQLSKGIQIGMRQAQRDGKWTSQPPYGYDRVEGYLQVNAEESEIVKQIFKWYVDDGFSFYKISSLLNEQNIKSKMGKKWGESTVRKLVDNPIYIGKQINYQTMMLDIFTNKIQVIEDSDRIIHKHEHLRIIDDKTFEKSQQQRKHRQILVENKTRYSNANLLSNLFYCGNCNGTMKRANKGSNHYYLCRNRARDKYHCEHYNYIREEDVINFIVDKIITGRKMFLNKNHIFKKYYDWYIEINLGGDFVKQLPEVLAKIEKLKKRKSNYFQMKADGEMSKEDFDIESKALEIELKELQLIEKRINNINDEIRDIYLIYETFIDALQNFSKETMTNQSLRKIFKKIIINTDLNEKKELYAIWNSGLDISFEEIMDLYLEKHSAQ